MKTIDLYPHKCENCGKKFEGSSQYALKLPKPHSKFYYFCSWHCIQAYRQTKAKKTKRAAV